MLHLYTSNRPDALAESLAAQMRAAPLPLFEADPVVVPSTAVARRLEFSLADALGIATRIDFIFPAAYVWRLFGRVLSDVAPTSPFDRAAMQWRLMRLLGDSEAVEVRRYLADDDGRRQFELAARLAGLFDRYLVERPEWLAAWNAGRRLGLGPDEAWQAGLWRTLAQEIVPNAASPTSGHPQSMKRGRSWSARKAFHVNAAEHPRERFFAQLRDDPTACSRLPRRIALFCVEAMPALYWEVFVALGEWIDVHVFALAPSREYWGDIARERERLRMEVEQPEAAALFESGHALLASLARARRPAAVRLADTPFASEDERFVVPPPTLLGRLQGDMLDLASSVNVPVDASIEVHACHGALREAEVLHDRLLALFATLPGLTSAEILVLTPDIETYAPAIEAVLTHAAPGRRIPCAMADRALAQLPCWRALRGLCAAAGGDLDAESVLAPLEAPAIRRAWNIAEGELAQLRDWVAAAGIRWGIDARDRQRRGLPATEAHAWRTGLGRLLFGVALPDAERLYGDVLPLPGIEGSRAELLGRFIDYVEAVFDLSSKVLGSAQSLALLGTATSWRPAPFGLVGAGPSQADAPPVGGSEPVLRARGANKVGAGRTATQWCALLVTTFERFVAPDETDQGDAQRVRAACTTLAAQARAAACDLRLPLAAILRELEAQLEAKAPARAFASGAATIAALQAGRPLAARVICLVGMHEGHFPRPASVPGFDLMARHPRPGDRERRGEERYAFLEALLCARDALVVTYAGRDPRGDSEYPPAAPLAELLDTLATMTGRAADDLVTRHPLQPFSPAYFDASRAELFSHDAEQCVAAATARAPRAVIPFLCAIAPEDEEEAAAADEVAVDRLRRFLVHPLRHFLRERLGIHLEAREELLEVHEPFVADGLLAYRLRAAFFDGWRAGRGAAETARLLAAQGALPHGVAGELACNAARDAVAPLWQAARHWVEAPSLSPCAIRFVAGTTTLVGTLEGLSAAGLWRVRHGRIRAVDRLTLWLDHLLLHVAAPAGVPLDSVLIAPDGLLRLGPQADAAARLSDLLDLYRSGAPLLFFAETAWAWVNDGDWRRAWYGDSFRNKPGERDDPYVRLALRDAGGDPLGEEFQRLAARVFVPLKDALTIMADSHPRNDGTPRHDCSTLKVGDG